MWQTVQNSRLIDHSSTRKRLMRSYTKWVRSSTEIISHKQRTCRIWWHSCLQAAFWSSILESHVFDLLFTSSARCFKETCFTIRRSSGADDERRKCASSAWVCKLRFFHNKDRERNITDQSCETMSLPYCCGHINSKGCERLPHVWQEWEVKRLLHRTYNSQSLVYRHPLHWVRWHFRQRLPWGVDDWQAFWEHWDSWRRSIRGKLWQSGKHVLLYLRLADNMFHGRLLHGWYRRRI